MDQGFPCPKGYYCPTGVTSPQACPEGKYNDLEESTGPTDCKSCLIGYFCDSSGLPSGTVCPDGYNCFDIEIINPLLQLDKYACPEGQYCTGGQVTDCIAGKYNPRKYGRTASDCLECPPGKACTQPGLSAPDADCAEKFYCTGGAARPTGTGAAGTPIQKCERGYQCPVGTPDQIPCERATYSTGGMSHFFCTKFFENVSFKF